MSTTLTVNVGSYSDVPTTKLRMTTISPGGCGELSWEYDTVPPYLGLLDLTENDRVEAFDGQGLVWRGRLETRKPTLQAGTGSWRMTALGYAASLRDQFYTATKTYPGGTAIESIFTDTRDLLAPDISTSNTLISATGRTLSGVTADLIGKNAHDIFEAAQQFGNSSNQRLYYHIWEGAVGTGQEAVLEVVPRPSTYGYVVSLAHGAIVDLDWSLSRLYNRIVVKWGSTPTYTVRNDTISQGAKPAGYGVIRSRLVSQEAVNSVTDAERVGDVLLNLYSSVQAYATQIRIPATAMVEDAVGSTLPAHRVKAGQFIRVRELMAGSIATREYQFYIAQTIWDDDARVLSCTPEGVDDASSILARYLRKERLT